MSYLTSQGQTPSGVTLTNPLSGRAAGTLVPLAANASWQSPWIYVDQYIGVATTLYSDQPGSYLLEYSEDGTTVGPMPAVTIQYTVMGQSRKGSFNPSAKFIRFTYTNGATAQTKFVFNIDLNITQTQPSSETLNAVGADTRMAVWNKSRIETKDSDTGAYAPVYRTGNSLNVHVDNQSDVSTLAKDATLTSGSQKTAIVGSVTVGNFPATQPVTGTFWQTTQPVSGTVTAIQGTTPWIVSSPTKTTIPLYGSLATSSTAANQVVKTYTVTTGKTFYLTGFSVSVQVGALAGLLGGLVNIGEASLFIGGTSGSKLWGDYFMASTVPPQNDIVPLSEPLPIAAGTTFGVYASPTSATGFTWRASLFGYEA